MDFLITICARGGSKGIPGKNIKDLNGKPLIAYTISLAEEFIAKMGGDIAISTDCTEIKKIAEKYGIYTDYLRPAHLADDSSGKVDVIRHLLEYHQKLNAKQYDYILDLDVSSPLRNYQDLINAYNIINNDQRALNLFSVNDAERSPYFCVVEKKENGYYNLVKTNGVFLSRQSAPSTFDLNGSFYFYKKAFFEFPNTTVMTDRSLVYVMPHICFDLDEPLDFEFLDFLINRNKLDFIMV
ncbi:acylneuraminate cytidylyltransferase family protein [Pedobacter hartonius]|uniref:N-acylneuraminate cytidylyltransferase n=1 Tax=Pedobacter hartonius TaxID=425514 RepID=A0A1H4FTA9_9SPHI|nr:acylneuraminate cytidylyltransferase family protein [Pedobacter hartonius]SEB00070.1 N-acylneuraminate cytidylyltransferase [Pedobacter hartonius]